jgi:hypothetical protein
MMGCDGTRENRKRLIRTGTTRDSEPVQVNQYPPVQLGLSIGTLDSVERTYRCSRRSLHRSHSPAAAGSLLRHPGIHRIHQIRLGRFRQRTVPTPCWSQHTVASSSTGVA